MRQLLSHALAASVSLLAWHSLAQAQVSPVAPQTSELSFVNISAQSADCAFATNCSVSAFETFGAISLPPGVSGTARLETRTIVGGAGSRGAGKTAYQYQVDMTQAVSNGEAPCVTDLSIDFGPVSKIAYVGTSTLFDVFTVFQGSSGKVGLFQVLQTGSVIDLTFEQPVCAGATPGKGLSSYFIGIASSSPPRAALVTVGWPGLLGLRVPSRAPAH